MSELTDALEKLDRQFGLKGLNTRERMHPGFSRVEIAELAKPLPFTLPEEVVEFFEWRNGFRNVADWRDRVKVCFFEGYDPMSLRRAIDFYLMAVKSFPKGTAATGSRCSRMAADVSTVSTVRSRLEPFSTIRRSRLSPRTGSRRLSFGA